MPTIAILDDHALVREGLNRYSDAPARSGRATYGNLAQHGQDRPGSSSRQVRAHWPARSDRAGAQRRSPFLRIPVVLRKHPYGLDAVEEAASNERKSCRTSREVATPGCVTGRGAS